MQSADQQVAQAHHQGGGGGGGGGGFVLLLQSTIITHSTVPFCHTQTHQCFWAILCYKVQNGDHADFGYKRKMKF